MPAYWAAIRLAIVSPGGNSDLEMALAPPITWVTAIASPTARPKPSMVEATSPPLT